MKVYSTCGRPGSCCMEINHDEENDVYRIFDNNEGWESTEVTFEQLINIRDVITELESKRKDIEDLD